MLAPWALDGSPDGGISNGEGLVHAELLETRGVLEAERERSDDLLKTKGFEVPIDARRVALGVLKERARERGWRVKERRLPIERHREGLALLGVARDAQAPAARGDGVSVRFRGPEAAHAATHRGHGLASVFQRPLFLR